MPIGRRAAIRTCLLAVGLGGCTGFGPDTMRYQQADYAAALADAGKRQTLLNIVKLRYGDVPAFVSVNQILAGYSLQGTFSVGTELLTGGSLRLSDDANVGVGGTLHQQPDHHLRAGHRRRLRSHLSGADAARRPVRADAGRSCAGSGPGPRPALDRRLRQRAHLAGGGSRGRRRIHRRCWPCSWSCNVPGGCRSNWQFATRSASRR